MSRVEVSSRPAGDGWDCEVTLVDAGGDGGGSGHRVHVARGDLARLAPGSSGPDELVRASFGFLLEREPKESILPAFDLPVIGRYFPEYEREIRLRLGA